ncbi:MAG: c-type cytochrome [Gammaproteobacteria bacterium]|nr:c-type cytochrome [Gammaproteobacteria bacterium]
MKRWLLAAGLGAGVILFAAKLLIIAGFSAFYNKPTIAVPKLTKADQVSAEPAAYTWAVLSNTVKPGVPLSSGTSRAYVWQALPTQAVSSTDNPGFAEKVALGEKLFSDPQLSYDGTVSCASCHKLYQYGGADGRAKAQGIYQQKGKRNTPTVWNAVFQRKLFWDGRVASLEEQAKGPLINPLEMGMPSFDLVVERVNSRPLYRQAFKSVFGADSKISIDQIVEAIAAYERTLVTADSAYDRFVNGDKTALTQQQIRGMALFESMACINCHSGPNFSVASVFSDEPPLRIFPANPTPLEERYPLFEQVTDRGTPVRSAWRVPSLRNVALTGPWLHNGSITDLKDMVRIMAAAQLGWAGPYLLWSDKDNTLREMSRPMPSEQQIEDVVAFLQALSSERLLECQQKKASNTGEDC